MPDFKEYAEKCRKLSEAATKGPWRTVRQGYNQANPSYICVAGDRMRSQVCRTMSAARPDGPLIDHNRTAADIWREAFMELVERSWTNELRSTGLKCPDELAEEAFNRAYKKVTGDEQ